TLRERVVPLVMVRNECASYGVGASGDDGAS
ncbi:hypothetical protein RTM1035_10240, partial [Roseovarius sp. TM1035]